MGLKTKFKSFFLLDDEYEDQEEEMMEKEYEEPEQPAEKPVGMRGKMWSACKASKSLQKSFWWNRGFMPMHRKLPTI